MVFDQMFLVKMLRRICRKPVFLRLSSNFNGPGLGDFIQGDVQEKTWSEYKVRFLYSQF